MKKSKIWGFLARLTIVYGIVYTLVGVAFVSLQNALPAPRRVALDFFQPYNVDLRGILAQIIVGLIVALVLYPFYDIIVKDKRGWRNLFAALWGVAILGSLEPRPGAIEGMLYTEITFLEHALVLGAGAVQMLIFALLFLAWERLSAGLTKRDISGHVEVYPQEKRDAKTIRGYIGRFTLLHVIVYMIVGIVFYEISGYQEAIETMEYFQLWRDLENIFMPFLILGGQILRGGILALLLYPFYRVFIQNKRGWLMFFGLLLGLKVLFISVTIPATYGELIQQLQDSIMGLPEIIVQTLLFACLFFVWERRRI